MEQKPLDTAAIYETSSDFRAILCIIVAFPGDVVVYFVFVFVAFIIVLHFVDRASCNDSW